MGALKIKVMSTRENEPANSEKQEFPQKETMLEEYERKRRRQVANMRSILDYGIGLAIVIAGLFLFFRNQMDLEFNETYPPNDSDKWIGVICVLYGGWRIYRGYKKNYFK